MRRAAFREFCDDWFDLEFHRTPFVGKVLTVVVVFCLLVLILPGMMTLDEEYL